MDKTTLKHILIRMGFIIGIPILLFLFVFSETGENSAGGGDNGFARGLGNQIGKFFVVVISLIIIIVGLLVDIFALYRKKEKAKFEASIVLLILTILLALLITPIYL